MKGVEIRKPDQLQNVSSLIIPGGESTTMARLAEYHNLVKLSLSLSLARALVCVWCYCCYCFLFTCTIEYILFCLDEDRTGGQGVYNFGSYES